VVISLICDLSGNSVAILMSLNKYILLCSFITKKKKKLFMFDYNNNNFFVVVLHQYIFYRTVEFNNIFFF